MQYLKRIFVIGLILYTGINCNAQQMLQVPKDVYKICRNDNQFLGKPLSTLLAEIKPEIKMVIVREGWIEEAPFIMFYFCSRIECKCSLDRNKKPYKITVYLKDIFEWSDKNKPCPKCWEWTKEDVERLGSNIMTRIWVSGDYDTEEIKCDVANY